MVILTSRNDHLVSEIGIKQAKPKEKPYKLSDGGGLLLRVKPNGFKTWIFDYYKPHKKSRTSISFGAYPEVSLAEARKNV